MRKKRIIPLLIVFLCLSSLACSKQGPLFNVFGPKEYTSSPLAESEKEYLNFITELPLGKGKDYNFHDFITNPTAQERFELVKGDSNTCAFAFDRKRYAYVGCNITPARIVKFDLQEMKRVGHLDLPAGENRDECRVAALIAINPETIIHASFNNPCVFTKIDGNRMEITGTLKGDLEGVSDKQIRGLTYDGKYVYAANYSIPSKIIKFDPLTMTKVDQVVFNNINITDVYALTICGHYLVGVCGREQDKDAAIFRLDLNNLRRKPSLLYIPGYAKYQSVCTDGEFIYAATYSNPVKVVKVDALAKELKFISAFEGKKDEETGNFSIVYNGEDVIVGTWQLGNSQKDRLIKINPNDMSRKATLIIPCEFPADLMYLAPYIYTACDKPTGVILRLKF